MYFDNETSQQAFDIKFQGIAFRFRIALAEEIGGLVVVANSAYGVRASRMMEQSTSERMFDRLMEDCEIVTEMLNSDGEV